MSGTIKFYAIKKRLLLIFLSAATLLSFAATLIYLLLTKDLSALGFCCITLTLALFEALYFVNCKPDITLDRTDGALTYSVLFGDIEGFTVPLTELERATAATRDALRRVSDEKHLPRRGICLFLTENRVKIIPSLWFSEKQVCEIVSVLNRFGGA